MPGQDILCQKEEIFKWSNRFHLWPARLRGLVVKQFGLWLRFVCQEGSELLQSKQVLSVATEAEICCTKKEMFSSQTVFDYGSDGQDISTLRKLIN